MPTIKDFLKAAQYLPDDAVIRPQWAPGCEPSDHEPGVELVGFDQQDGQVIARVKLFYLDEIEDEETANADADAE